MKDKWLNQLLKVGSVVRVFLKAPYAAMRCWTSAHVNLYTMCLQVEDNCRAIGEDANLYLSDVLCVMMTTMENGEEAQCTPWSCALHPPPVEVVKGYRFCRQ